MKLKVLVWAIVGALAGCGPFSFEDAYREKATGDYGSVLYGTGFDALDGREVRAVTWAEAACQAEASGRIEEGPSSCSW